MNEDLEFIHMLLKRLSQQPGVAFNQKLQ